MNKDLLKGFEPKLQDALDGVISLFDMDTMRWFARLWDPAVGAFYYSNSGRDYEGFGPDLESTVQGLRCVAGKGMLDSYGGSLKAALPEEIKNKLIAFTNRCADPDGYYYHPQWGKAICAQRRGRDLSWAGQIYTWFDAKPPYPTAIERLKSGNDGGIGFPDYLKSKAEFIKYLDSLDFANKSYSAGNALNAQSDQIIAAGLMDSCIDYLEAHQRADNGLWEEKISYDSISGLMKVSGFFQRAKRRFPNYQRAVDSCMEMSLSDTPANAVVFVYNPFSAVLSVCGAMDVIGEHSVSEAIKERYRENLVPLAAKTREKLIRFRKPDGSFSYVPEYSSSKSQGAPVALYHENEGDVNATTIAMSGGVGMLLAIVGIPFKIYDGRDYDEFLEILLSQKPVVKKPVPEGRESRY